MMRRTKKKSARGRVPIEAVLRLGSRPLSTPKGLKGYERSREKEQEWKNISEQDAKEIN